MSDERWVGGALLASVRHSSPPIVGSSLRPTREAAPPAGKECKETTRGEDKDRYVVKSLFS